MGSQGSVRFIHGPEVMTGEAMGPDANEMPAVPAVARPTCFKTADAWCQPCGTRTPLIFS